MQAVIAQPSQFSCIDTSTLFRKLKKTLFPSRNIPYSESLQIAITFSPNSLQIQYLKLYNFNSHYLKKLYVFFLYGL